MQHRPVPLKRPVSFADCIFRPQNYLPHKRYEACLILNNLAGNSEWQRRIITTTQTIYSINALRPREVLARLMLNL